MSESHLYLVRHGQTDWNIRGILQGRSDIPLNESGRAQALAAKKALQGIAFDAVYSSPLCRALETACTISGATQSDLCIDERLVEVCFGASEGKLPSQFSASIQEFFATPGQYQPEDGAESLASVFRRTESFLRFAARSHKGETLLAASHGAAIACILNSVQHCPIQHLWQNLLGNCCMAHLALQGEAWQLAEIINPFDNVFESPYQQ